MWFCLLVILAYLHPLSLPASLVSTVGLLMKQDKEADRRDNKPINDSCGCPGLQWRANRSGSNWPLTLNNKLFREYVNGFQIPRNKRIEYEWKKRWLLILIRHSLRWSVRFFLSFFRSALSLCPFASFPTLLSFFFICDYYLISEEEGVREEIYLWRPMPIGKSDDSKYLAS